MSPNAADNPRIGHLVWNLIRGGTEGQCARVALELARQGVAQRVVVFRREGFFVERVEAACGPLGEMPIERLLRVDTIRAIHALKKYLVRESIDILHAWDADAAFFGALAAKWAGIPYITSRRDLGEIYPRWKLCMMDWADRGAARLVTNAEAIARRLPATTVRRTPIVTIPNVLDCSEFDREAEQPHPKLPPGPCIAMVARLDPEKDVDTVIATAAELVARVPTVQVLIIGDGRERERLEQRTRDLGLTATVHFLGAQTAIPALLRKCVAGILLPCTNEGLSNTLLEYMAARLPVVATDCGGNAELVRTGETGTLVPIKDAHAAADVLAGWLGDADTAQKLGRQGRARVEAHHLPQSIAPQFVNVYQAVLTDVSNSNYGTMG